VIAAGFARGAVGVTLALIRYYAAPPRLKRLAGGLTVFALAILGVGVWLRPDPVPCDRPATLVLIDTSQAMGNPLSDAATEVDSAGDGQPGDGGERAWHDPPGNVLDRGLAEPAHGTWHVKEGES